MSSSSTSSRVFAPAPADTRGPGELDPSHAEYLLLHWNDARSHRYCGECDELVSTLGEIEYSGCSCAPESKSASSGDGSPHSRSPSTTDDEAQIARLSGRGLHRKRAIRRDSRRVGSDDTHGSC
ncbi:hypothetical protein HWV62_9381 [Athelia sp. TMB]|nr:hypothetical protein HWV62_9381 [Athelia sp. TMB]